MALSSKREYQHQLDLGIRLAESTLNRSTEWIRAKGLQAEQHIQLFNRMGHHMLACSATVLEMTRIDRTPQAGIVARTAFEASTMLLWASRAKDGWHRLKVWAAKEDERLFRRIEEINLLDQQNAATLEQRRKFLSANEAYATRPSMLDCMLGIQKEDAKSGTATATRADWVSWYVLNYGLLSGLAHANFSYLHPIPELASMHHLALVVSASASSFFQADLHIFAQLGQETDADLKSLHSDVIAGLQDMTA